MINIDTLLLVSERKELRQKLRAIFEEEYNILECKQIELSRLMMEQNSTSIAAVLLDLDKADKGKIEKLRTLCTDSAKLEIPVIAILNRHISETERLVFEAGAADAVTRKCDSAVVRYRVQKTVEMRREKSGLKALVERQSEIILHANETLIDTLSSLIEYRSAESGLHILRIRRFTKILLDEIARTCPEYGLDERAITEITSASALHDVGKIAIPDAILNKPGKLLPDERKVIETHAIIGAQIIERMSETIDPNYLRYAYNICKYHHERWDGKGYPTGMKGDDIPICAQAVGLADVYDALTNRRVYKDAYSAERAVQMILNGECGQFSPKLLECFKTVRHKFFELSKRYSDDRAVREDKVVDLVLPSPVHQKDISSLHKTQNKYNMLLHYLNATVIEISMTLQNYHVVYNPTPELALLNTGATFRESIESLMARYARPEERQEVTDCIFSHIEQHRQMGLKRLTFDVSFGGGDSLYKQKYEITLMSMNRVEEDKRVMLMIWNKKQDESAAAEPSPSKGVAQKIFEKITNGCIIRNDHYLTLEDNSAVAYLLGYTPSEFEARFHNRLIKAVAPEDRETLVSEIQTQLEQNSEVEMILRLQHSGGENVHVLFKGRTCVDENGIEQIVGSIIKIEKVYNELKSAVRDLERIQTILDQQDHAIFEWDMVLDEFVYARNWNKIFGHEPGRQKVTDLLHNSVSIHPDDLEKLNDLVSRGNMGKQKMQLDMRVLCPNGRYNWHRIHAVIERDKKQKTRRVVGIIFNFDQEKRSEQMLLQKTEVDALTRLLNKEAGRKYVEDCLADHRLKEQSALLLIDLDNFKSVNDRYGHMFGDAVLCEAAMVIRKHFRPDDIVARIGGDEFMVMMRPNVTLELIQKRCSALCSALKTQFEKLIHEGKTSCSIGIALAPKHANNYAELFQRADQALYMSKKKGKNTFSVYDASDASYRSLQIPEAFNTRIESDEKPGLVDSGIVRYAFKRLYEAQNEEEAINDILMMIGEQMNVDRVYIFENSPDDQYCSNTFEWCHDGIEPQIHNLQNIHYEHDIAGFRESFNEQGLFYCPDVEKLSEPVYSTVKSQNIKSMLACAIRERGVFRGYVGFDECTEERIWTKEQIDALIFFSEMLSIFLIKMRAQNKTNQYVDNLTSILDSRPECVYVVEADTYEIKFVNAKARKTFKGIDVGKRCFETLRGGAARCEDCPTRKVKMGADTLEQVECTKFGWTMHVEASAINWQGKKAYLIVCRDSDIPNEDDAADSKSQ